MPLEYGNFPDCFGSRLWKCCSCCEFPPTEESSHALPLSWVAGLCWGHPQATALVMLNPAGLDRLKNYWCPLSHVNASTMGTASHWHWHHSGSCNALDP